ncbi:hypothetical protein EXIGLDRAFT_762825 [Exidia glandulosa HHB12029]|uniref:Diacylglycerol O-acyltransferase n=1 Tax=Exidia glandulosa HHB12029 TaxID=1314781 RepID=A0A166BA19_EXIGL|nr:hypothetical protein EXIGLDRAFT_762825 [Exidia glandulosa HHB12029]
MTAPRRLRELGPYERFSLSRTLIGFAPVPVIVVQPKTSVSHDALSSAVKELLLRYPLLRCCIPEASHPHPYWASNDDLGDADIIQTVNGSTLSVAELLQAHSTTSTPFDLRSGPLWRVILHAPTDSTPSILVLSVHHALSDGVGSKNLLSELLRLIAQAPDPVADSKLVRADMPPTLENTVDVRPTWMYMINVLLTELVFPLLPAWIRPAPRQIWPNPLRVKPYTQPTRFSFIRISASDVLALKEAGKSRGVRTLHPLLLAMSYYALWEAAGAPKESVQMDGSTPMSERRSDLGHPACTGNFVSSHVHEASLSHTTPFWALAREVASSLASPAGKSSARGRMGMLAYIPSPDAVNEKGQTGFEVFLEKKVTTLDSVSPSIAISNLGLLPGSEVDEVAWAQPAYPAGEALCMNVVASENGPLNITLNWRAGVISETEAERFVNTFKHIASSVAQNTVADGAVFANILYKPPHIERRI